MYRKVTLLVMVAIAVALLLATAVPAAALPEPGWPHPDPDVPGYDNEQAAWDAASSSDEHISEAAYDAASETMRDNCNDAVLQFPISQTPDGLNYNSCGYGGGVAGLWGW